VLRLWLLRLAGLLRRGRIDRDLDEEVRFHVARLEDAGRARGLSVTAARHAALREFGGIDVMKDAYRDQGSLPAIENLVRDARYALRSLARTPAFTAAALLTLALGIGATAGMFGVVRAVLLRPLPYPGSDRIVQIVRAWPDGIGAGQTGRRYLHFREALHAVEALAAWRSPTGYNLAVGDRAEFVRAASVSREYFDVFGVPPAIGGGFTADQDSLGGPDVAVLGHGLWTRLFAGDPAALGRTITLGGRPHTVVGVMPPDFQPLEPAEVLIPLRPSTTGPGGGFNYRVAGRLRPGVTTAQAASEVGSAWEGLREAFPTEVLKGELPSTAVPLQELETSDARPMLLMMSGAVGLLLLIACANTANLLLARASGREREIALRAALGAGRGRLVRQLLTESVVLAAAGSLLGLLLARWTVPALLAMAPPEFVIRGAAIDGTVALVALGLALTTGVGFGLFPALGMSGASLVGAFREDGTRTTAGRGATVVRRGLVIGEVAICMALLIGAGLLLRTVLELRAVDLGFNPSGVVTAQMSLQGSRYSEPPDWNRFFETGLERIGRLPGVESAAVVNGVPIERGLNLNVDVLDGPERVERALTDWRYASAGYFETMGLSIVEGRAFDGRDRAGAAPVAVVNEEFARRFFKRTSALGRHVRVFKTDGAIEIVGIMRDVREQGLTVDIPAVMFVPVAQANPAGVLASHTYFQMNWVVRAPSAGPGLASAIGDVLRDIDPQQPISALRTMDEIHGAQMETERFELALLAAFALVGLTIAAAGIYGLIAYSVAQRTREFGIRLALGATRGRVLASVVRDALSLVAAGIAAGSLGALALAGVLRRFVWGVSPVDPWTFAGVGLLLLAVAAAATIVPALRTLRLDPVGALRE
jgi:putative ABC transport system permease protein